MGVLLLILSALLAQACLGFNITDINSEFVFLKRKPENSLSRILFGNAGRKQLKITNGEIAEPGDIPYQVAVGIQQGTSNYFCGGTLLTPRYVITAAHCFPSSSFDKVFVRFGATDLTNWDSPQGQISLELKENAVTLHPEYTSDISYNDIAIIDLGKDITLSGTIGVVKLPSSPFEPGQSLTASGWGKTSDGSAFSPILRYIEIPSVNNTYCEEWYWNMIQYNIIDSQMCTDYYNGQTTCRGDSGGPVVKEDDDGSVTLVGIVSLGVKSCEVYAPSVNTDVYDYVSFIKENTDYTD